MRFVCNDRFVHLPLLLHATDAALVFVPFSRQSLGNKRLAVQSVLKILSRRQRLVGRGAVLLLVRTTYAKFEFDFGSTVAAGSTVDGGFVGAEVYFVFEDYEPFFVWWGCNVV